MTFAPTVEQSRIIDRIVSKTVPVIAINAGPGCAKTTTIIEAIKALSPELKQQWKSWRCRVIYTAFNKDIVNETARRLVEAKINTDGIYKVDCATFNSLGMRRFKGILENPSRSIQINMKKNKDVLKWIQDQGRYSISPEEWPDLETLMRGAKSQGYVPPKSGCAFKTLVTFHELCKTFDITPEPHYEAILNSAIARSVQLSFNYELDFDDQLYMAALWTGASSDKPLFIFVDEAQDLTPVQLFLLKRMQAEFVVLVGDPMQAIYAFRGAMSDSFKRIYAVWPDAMTMPLMTSFRVPQAVLPILRERNPALNTMSPIKGGIEAPARSMEIKELLAGRTGSAAILCRNNAPLYRAALACISARVPFNLSDDNWGNGLIRDIKRVVHNDMQGPAGATFIGVMLHHWLERAGDDAKLNTLARDKIASLEALIELTQPSTVGALCLTITSLLKKSAPDAKLLLSTAHKAKGLEFDFVVHLDSHLIPAKFATTPEQIAQEHNIAYVINSRTKNTLAFIDSLNITIPGTAPRNYRNPAKKDTIS